MKKILNADYDNISQEPDDLMVEYFQEFNLQDKTQFSQLYLSKKKPEEALNAYIDIYPLLNFRKKLLYLK